MAARYCESCGIELLADARFCEACGAAVPHDAPPTRAAVPVVPSPVRKPLESAGVDGSSVRMPPSTRRSGVGWLLALAALVLAGAVAVWFVVPRSDPPQGNAPPVATRDVAIRDIPPTALPAERPPLRAPITRADIERLRDAVDAANRAHVAAIFASREPPPPELQAQLDQAMGALGQALYRYHVEDGQGDLEAARAEMRAFLEGLDGGGLGLSAPAIDAGVADVAP
jgi:hypothetical protein